VSKEIKMGHKSQHFKQFLICNTLGGARNSVHSKTIVGHRNSDVKENRQLNTTWWTRGSAVGLGTSL
jgi:hypothetical protein